MVKLKREEEVIMTEKKVVKKVVEKKEPVKKVAKATVKDTVKEVVAAPEVKETVVKAPEPVKEKAAPVKKASVNVSEEVFVQFGNSEVLTKDIVEKVKAAYVAEGHTADSVKKIRVYIKPEEGMAYYVVNDDYASGIRKILTDMESVFRYLTKTEYRKSGRETENNGNGF